MTTLARHAFIGGGGSLAIRPGGGARLVVSLLGGRQQHRFAGRGELLGQLLLFPQRARGIGVYGLGGVAATLGPRDAGWLVLGLGIESAPAGRSGWYLEGGVGGGVRVAAGWRWRRLSVTPTEVP